MIQKSRSFRIVKKFVSFQRALFTDDIIKYTLISKVMIRQNSRVGSFHYQIYISDH